MAIARQVGTPLLTKWDDGGGTYVRGEIMPAQHNSTPRPRRGLLVPIAAALAGAILGAAVVGAGRRESDPDSPAGNDFWSFKWPWSWSWKWSWEWNIVIGADRCDHAGT